MIRKVLLAKCCLPDPSEAMRPKYFAMSVFNERYCCNMTPDKILRISGIPEPVQC